MSNITVVQTTGNSSYGVPSATFSINNTQGNTLVATGWSNSSGAVSILDTLSNQGWVQVGVSEVTNGSDYLFVMMLKNCKAGTNTVTAGVVGSSIVSLISLSEISGADTIDQLSQNSQTSSGTTLTCPAITSTKAVSIVIAAVQTGSAQGSPISPFSLLSNAPSNQYGTAGYDVVTLTGTYTPTMTITNGQNCGSIVFNLYAAGGGGDTYDSTKPYLGTVTVVGSAPAGIPNPFIGKMLILSGVPATPPSGTLPYLGHVVEGSAPSSGPDNLLGQVVVVTSAPAGVPDPFLGTIDKE